MECYSKVIADQSLFLETTATHLEILDSWSTKGDRRIRNVVLLALSGVVRHGPYGNWRAVNIAAADLNLERRVATWSSELKVKQIRVDARKSSKTSLVGELLIL